ncbi:MAG: pyridoxamine kinase [Lachnospiraceae bacterium]|nr:pyridoxamine kinase [Lachnospiraceae bacterium]
MTNHNNQKKIALINDISGFGRCSVAVQQPVISMLKVQCCPIPTAIFSNHTGFKNFYNLDFTKHMESYIAMWKELDLRFNGICTGFLGSAKQIKIVSDFITDFKSGNTLVIVDPVMGDYGKPYPTYTREMCEHMSKLVEHADIVTPNLTEACILAKLPYKDHWTKKELLKLAEAVSALGPEKVVITGIPQKTFVCNYCYEKGLEPKILKTHRVGTSRSGTGDIFTAIIAADAVNGVDFQTSVKKASLFVKKCIMRSIELEIPLTDGVAFEEILYKLK